MGPASHANADSGPVSWESVYEQEDAHVDLTLTLPDDLVPSKSPEELLWELRTAAAMYWLVRGQISAEQAKAIAARQARKQSFKELLLAMPDVGEDADFERPVACSDRYRHSLRDSPVA